MMKKVGGVFLAVILVMLALTEMIRMIGKTSEAPFVVLMDMEDHTALLAESFKHANARRTDNTSSAGDYKYTIKQDGTAKILKYLKEEKEVRIPPELGGHPVSTIGKEAFDYKLLTTSIQIPWTVTEIESGAFSRTGIKRMMLPESVVKIGDNAFWYCRELEQIYISKNVEKMEGNIVQGSNKLTKIDIDLRNDAYASVDGIVYNKDMTELLAVPGGKDLAGFQFLDSVVCIGAQAFYGNTSVSFTELVIPDKITTLGAGAFSYCENIRKVIIGKQIMDIPDYAFLCSGVSEIVIHGRPKKIGSSAFCDCYFLTKINIPDGVTEIGDMAFYNCGALESIMVPGSVTQIGNKAIGYSEDCSELTGATITGGKGTDAYRYAKRAYVAFRDVETGEIIRYDLVLVPRERIEFLFAGKKRIELDYKEIEKATYQVAVREVGTSSWEKHYAVGTSATVRRLKAKKQYEVKVRALREIEGEEYYGKWSKVKKVTMGSGVM